MLIQKLCKAGFLCNQPYYEDADALIVSTVIAVSHENQAVAILAEDIDAQVLIAYLQNNNSNIYFRKIDQSHETLIT